MRASILAAGADDAIAQLAPPRTPHDAMRYALDRYVVMEKAVATVTAARLPAGCAGRAVRDRWLGPARGSLRAGRSDLEQLRRAVRAGELSEARSAFEQAATAGDAGVDVTVFAERAVPHCRTTFTTQAPSISW